VREGSVQVGGVLQTSREARRGVRVEKSRLD
jgi:hypothetical protein